MSGAPIVEEEGKLVGILSNGEFSHFAMENMFAPVRTIDLKEFLNNYVNK